MQVSTDGRQSGGEDDMLMLNIWGIMNPETQENQIIYAFIWNFESHYYFFFVYIITWTVDCMYNTEFNLKPSFQ